ncbi:class I SAM-dependent methyltransferase [Rubrobacter tropicus]|uniref:class I SAM-dependent methyltransferase n=1 Tax=Rubrobacter tropicus TaxID=2653851 RepID=UPI001D18CA40|nr:hypothetical protein [Rubrobacter tropicus]
MTAERERLRSTFDRAALLYDEVRPGYPEGLFEEVVSLSGVPSGGRILEIGCGTGQATLPLARRGTKSCASSSAGTWPPWPARTWPGIRA